MMKGMIFLAQHPQLFKNAKLNKVSTMALNQNAILEESLEKLNENYRLIALEYQKVTGKTLNELTIGKEVNSDATAFVNIALDLLRDAGDKEIDDMLEYKTPFKDIEDGVEYSLSQIKSMINTLKYSTDEKLGVVQELNHDDPKVRALIYLYRAFLSKIGYQISPEERVGKYSSNGINLNGLYATSFADSPSAIARTIHEATYSFTRVCQNEFVRYTSG